MDKNKNGNKVEVEILPIYYDYILTQSYPVNILVGGRNSGKSFFMEQFANYKLHNSKKYKMLVVEDVEVNIGAGVKDGILERADEFGLDGYVTGTKVPPEVTHRVTGNTVIFKGYHSTAQQKQVKSLNEVTAAWYEEGENITYEQFKALRMQLRGGEESDRQLFITMNPINEGGYISQEFFQKEPDEVFERFPDGRPKVFVRNIEVEVDDRVVVIPCMVVVTTYKDNPYLTDEQRADIEELKYSNPDLHKMLAEGKFVKGGGVYFPEFERHIHVVEPFSIPEHWHRYTAKDYGLDMLANYWIAVDTYGDAWVYKELHEPELIVSKAAERIKQVNGSDKIQIKYAPPDLNNRQKDAGKSIMDLFREYGESLNRSDNRRVDGWLALKEWLKPIDRRDPITGEVKRTSRMKIFSTCPNLIKSLSSIQRSESDPNDCATEPHDITHAADALRYFAIMRQITPAKPEQPINQQNARILQVKPQTDISDDYINMRVR